MIDTVLVVTLAWVVCRLWSIDTILTSYPLSVWLVWVRNCLFDRMLHTTTPPRHEWGVAVHWKSLSSGFGVGAIIFLHLERTLHAHLPPVQMWARLPLCWPGCKLQSSLITSGGGDVTLSSRSLPLPLEQILVNSSHLPHQAKVPITESGGCVYFWYRTRCSVPVQLVAWFAQFNSSSGSSTGLVGAAELKSNHFGLLLVVS